MVVALSLLMTLLAPPAWAGTDWYLETAVLTDRVAADEAAKAAAASGMQARVVRRFQLGRGWEYVLLVEHVVSLSAANEAAPRLARAAKTSVQVYRNEDGRALPEGDPASVATAVAATPGPARGVGEIVRRIEQAHGGAQGGAASLARAPAVRFSFARTLSVDGRIRTMEHDYWRAAAGRRLEVRTAGAGADSLAVASDRGAWMRANGAVINRDAGVLVTTIDAFAPEAVLTLALDVPSLLRAPEVARFKPLEGAESGVRIGLGGDDSEPGLSFLDADPATGRLRRVRYVTEAGPLNVELSRWKEAAPGVLYPEELRIERADGAREVVRVQALEVLTAAPAGTFSRP